MELLPELVLIKIFNRVPLYDRLTIRLVSKQWKHLVDEQLTYSTKELVLFYMMERRPLIWHHCDQPVDLHNSIIVNCKFRTSECFKRLFRRIRRLYIAAISSDININHCELRSIEWSSMQEEFFDHVNCFTELEHFELYHSKCLEGRNPGRDEAPFEIHLKNLKTFYYETKNRGKLTSIASPKLEQLSFFEEFRLTANFDCFKNSLKFLKVHSFFCNDGYGLPNLEQLYFCRDLQIRLSAFKKLREIHCYFLEIDNVMDFPFNPEPIRAIFNDLFEQRSILERRLLVFFDGNRCEPDSVTAEVALERIRGVNSLNFEHVFIRKTDLELYQQNQQDHFRVEHLRKHLEYTNELNEVIAAMSDWQIEKLARSLDSVTVADQLNTDHLLLSKLRGLFRYVQHLLIHDRFPQYQLELLPDILPALISLRGAQEGITQPEVIHYNKFLPLARPCFLASKFKGLKDVSIATGPYTFEGRTILGGQASPKNVEQILDQCRFLKSLQVHAGELSVYFLIYSNQPGRYHFKGNKKMHELLNLKFPMQSYLWPHFTGKKQVIEFLLRYGFFETNKF